MNEMYDMSIVTHNLGVMGILVVFLVNVLMLLGAKDIRAYKRKMTLFTPIGSTMIGAVLFTGIIMMAAKHLDFTIENIVMMVFAVIFIFLEVKRTSTLKYIDVKKEDALSTYKSAAITILQIEVIITLAISAWMWI